MLRCKINGGVNAVGKVTFQHVGAGEVRRKADNVKKA
jgi:hypothetical protein